MSVILYRVDDRLVHGQVVLGWARPLKVNRLILVDDAISTTQWEQDLYRMAVPAELSLRFADLHEAVTQLPQWEADREPGILLTGDLPTMAALRQAHPELVRRINLGGIHQGHDRAQRLSYLYLTLEEEDALRQLEAGGAEITAQDLPTSPPVRLEALIR